MGLGLGIWMGMGLGMGPGMGLGLDMGMGKPSCFFRKVWAQPKWILFIGVFFAPPNHVFGVKNNVWGTKSRFRRHTHVFCIKITFWGGTITCFASK